MFALANVIEFVGINLKCRPEDVVDRRERYPAVQPGYHMNKKHWITVGIDGSLPDKLIFAWVQNSYDVVVESLSKSEKLSLNTL